MTTTLNLNSIKHLLSEYDLELIRKLVWYTFNDENITSETNTNDIKTLICQRSYRNMDLKIDLKNLARKLSNVGLLNIANHSLCLQWYAPNQVTQLLIESKHLTCFSDFRTSLIVSKRVK